MNFTVIVSAWHVERKAPGGSQFDSLGSSPNWTPTAADRIIFMERYFEAGVEAKAV
jgi:hypothetical protein